MNKPRNAPKTPNGITRRIATGIAQPLVERGEHQDHEASEIAKMNRSARRSSSPDRSIRSIRSRSPRELACDFLHGGDRLAGAVTRRIGPVYVSGAVDV